MNNAVELRRVFAPALVALLVTGCGGGDGGGSSADSAAGGDAAAENPVDAATAGNIAGSIVFEGDAQAICDAVDEGVVAGDLADVEDVAIREALVAQGLDV